MEKQKFIDELTDVFFPGGIKCIVCGIDIPKEKRFPVCSKWCVENNDIYCLTCGRNVVASGQYCLSCKDNKWNFAKARAPFVFKGEVKRLIHRLKYGNCKYLARELSVYLADAYFEHSLMSDIISFVPMHSKKQKRRGYNQAEELARCLSQTVGCSCEKLLVKTVFAKSNAGQNSEQRLAAVKDTFSVAESEGKAVEIKNKRILLVDDVFTTGATVNECARVLLSAGAAEVNVLTLASVSGSIKRKSVKLSDLKINN